MCSAWVRLIQLGVQARSRPMPQLVMLWFRGGVGIEEQLPAVGMVLGGVVLAVQSKRPWPSKTLEWFERSRTIRRFSEGLHDTMTPLGRLQAPNGQAEKQLEIRTGVIIGTDCGCRDQLNQSDTFLFHT